MSIVVVVVISVIGVLVAYLGVAATLCVLQDRSKEATANGQLHSYVFGGSSASCG
jgi:hypothetical protein